MKTKLEAFLLHYYYNSIPFNINGICCIRQKELPLCSDTSILKYRIEWKDIHGADWF